jgi:hypothetical protein
MYELIICLILFFSYFSMGARLVIRKIIQFGYTVDRPVKTSKAAIVITPCSVMTVGPIFEFRGHGMKVL